MTHDSLISCVFVCVLGLSDREDWLELNDRGVKTILPADKPVHPVDKDPAPVAQPHVDPDLGPDALVQPKNPNIPILPKPPIKVRHKCLFLIIHRS